MLKMPTDGVIELAKPAWQTDELADEWIDQDEEEDSVAKHSLHNCSTSDLSLTQPIGSVSVQNDSLENSSPSSVGTFLIREDIPTASLLPQTPGRNAKAMVKDFFSPLPLEKMFEPPSPPSHDPIPLPSGHPSAPPVPSPLAQVYIPGNDEADDVGQGSGDVVDDELQEFQDAGDASQGRVTSPVGGEPLNYEFTFEMPRNSPFNPMGSLPEAQSTPGFSHPSSNILHPPPTDPRLRLFQFQYDTFTREHLSAMVDSIAVNTPSGGSRQSPNAASLNGLSPVYESNVSRLRSIKRIKLSPPSDYSDAGDGAAVILRPLTSRMDYVGESQSLMEKIRQARDFSTVSTVATAQSPDGPVQDSPSSDPPNPMSKQQLSFLAVPDADVSKAPSSNGTTSSSSSNKGISSSSAYREQAASLMAQIRNDMKGTKRLFSGDTEPSRTFAEDENETSIAQVMQCNIDKDVVDEASNTSLHSQRLLGHFPIPLVGVTVTTVPTAPCSPADAQNEGIDPAFLAPPLEDGPAYPSSVPSGRMEDLRRFVSSSTASGTITSGSAASFVKHPGSPQITRIRPNDVPALPDRVGNMVFDKVMMKWVKDASFATAGPADAQEVEVTHEADTADSEDPFRDIENFREEDSQPPVERDRQDDEGSANLEKSKIERDAESEVEDEEEMELTSFSFDVPPLESAQSEEDPDLDASELEDQDVTGMTGRSVDAALDSSDNACHDDITTEHQTELPDSGVLPRQPAAILSTPVPSAGTATGPIPSPNIRSVLKSNSVTPIPAMRDGSGIHTPANCLTHRRSVSFSDGKRDGQILGLGRNVPTPDSTIEAVSPVANGSNESAAVMVPSARSKRIAEMLDNLEDLSLKDESPSKASTSGRPPAVEPRPMEPPRPNVIPSDSGVSGRGISRRVSRSHSLKSPRSSSRNANGTFLTECSFGVAHDRLVQVITDVQPFEPYWEDLNSIDLSKRNVDSVARLKEFLPRLDSLSLNCNQLSWLSGVPGTVRSLSVATNALTGITSFSHLLNLESLDISRNHIDSLRQLECLRHLRELRADGNKINSIDGLQRMDGLVKLSLQGNILRNIDLDNCRWTRLEMLNLSQNRLVEVVGLASLPALVVLNLDNNSLAELESSRTLPRLRILRVSGNRLLQLNAPAFPNLRTLYADNNMLGTIVKADRLMKLENLSLRNQSGRMGLSLSMHDVRDVKRLYLSGNPLDINFLTEPCYNLVYLEAAACRLTALPTDLARLIPNVRVLNLNYNFLTDARPLAGLTRLRKLTLIGSRIAQARQFVRVLQGMDDVEMIDFRMNPCTLGWYLPLLVRDLPGALQPSDKRERVGSTEVHASRGASPARRGHSPDGDDCAEDADADGDAGVPTWKDLDAKFRRDLPDAAYVGRLAYRGLVMRACARIRMLDGVEVGEKEREKAERLLSQVLGARARQGRAQADERRREGEGRVVGTVEDSKQGPARLQGSCETAKR